ncbi:MAG: ATP-dependent Clp protease ATP-binding subunit ClpX, partial [Alphaproteobacteria bacterium]|nr:ATP-dependent Clp protease ATP-binding subunit ClpX [Alphaproteobacteria bacterium]
LRSIVEAILLDTMYDLPTETGIAEVVVDADVVAGRKEPIRVMKGKDAAEEAA